MQWQRKDPFGFSPRIACHGRARRRALHSIQPPTWRRRIPSVTDEEAPEKKRQW